MHVRPPPHTDLWCIAKHLLHRVPLRHVAVHLPRPLVVDVEDEGGEDGPGDAGPGRQTHRPRLPQARLLQRYEVGAQSEG